MKFEQYLKQKINSIQKEVAGEVLRWEKDVIKKTPQLKKLTKILLDSNQGGKYIRGALVCLGYDLYSINRTNDIYKLAAAYEILHTSLLIHDDIIDKSFLRRGKPTVYQKLGGGHFGISQAISLGNVGFFLSIRLINKTNFSESVKSNIVDQFSQTVLATLSGERLDVENAEKSNRLEGDIFLIHELKTALYTIAGPLLVGAISAGKSSAAQRKNIIEFGKCLGIAYQIQDDILGVFGDEKKVGKSVTSDIEEGKNTLLISYALDKASLKQKKILIQSYGKGSLSFKEHKLIMEIFKQSGSLNYSEKKFAEYVNQARILVALLAKNYKMQQILLSLIDFISSREK